MKFKTLKEKVIPIAMAALTVFSVSVFGAGAEQSKKYLKDMPYPDIESNLKESAYDKYSFTEFSGNIRRYFFDNDVECENAMKLEWNAYREYYQDYNHPNYKITYNLNKEFKNFHSEIFTEGDDYYSRKVDFEILGDGNRLIKRSITGESDIINIDLDTTNVQKLVIVVESVPAAGLNLSLVFNNAHLTKEGAPVEEPTERPTSIAPTEAPTEAPTSIATEAPTEKATEAPTEIATTTTEISTEVVKPTSAEQQAPTSVPTSATQSGTNSGGTSSNNTSGGSNISSGNAGSSGKVVSTGEEYLLFITISVLSAGVLFVLFFVIKKKSVKR